MSKFERVTLIFTVVSFILVFLLGSQGLILKPLFSIDVTEENSLTNIEIKNIGMAQAKNSIVNVISTVPLNMTSNFCVENSIIKLDDKQIILSFDRFSTGIACKLIFDGKIKFSLDHITASADDTSGLEWNPYDDLMSRLLWFQITLYGTLISVIGALTSLTITTYLKRETRIKVKGYKRKEDEVIIEIRLAEDEINSLQQSLSITNDSTVINSIIRRIQFLDDRIRTLYLELDQAKSSISLEGRSEKMIGKFYMNWTDLEQSILRIAERAQIDPVRMNISRLVRELQLKEVLSKEFVDSFNKVRKFRNGLVHGFISPQDNELTNQIVVVNNLLNVLQNIHDTHNNNQE